jgi:hypothetical protein
MVAAGTAASFLAISSVVRWELGFVGMVGAYYLAGLVLSLGRVE